VLTLYDEFAGWGGSSQGATAVPGVELVLAANHAPIAVQVHGLNFPRADHYLGDVTKADLTRFPRADLFWASPACPPFSNARGQRQYFDHATQQALFDDPTETPEDAARRRDLAKRRALMEEVPRYLRAIAARGEPVLAGCVENVVPARKWDQFTRWRREIEAAGPYDTRLIALNAMHARPVATAPAPQSRDRLFLAFWLRALGRRPDWDKWLRPRAWCPTCDQWVDAVQTWKKPGQDMGVYGIRHGQYVYRCPRIHGGSWTTTRRPGIVEPAVLPAATAIDWTLPPGPRIGDRVDAKGRPDPLEPATLARIAAGLRRHHQPAPAHATGPDTRNDAESDAVVPLLVPTTGRDRPAYPPDGPLRTQTARQETALTLSPASPTTGPAGGGVVPFLASLRGGGAKTATRTLDQPLLTFSASGTHHALIRPPALVMRNNSSRGARAEMSTPVEEPLRTLTTRGHQSLITSRALLLPYYSQGTARPVTQPVGTLTTRDRYAVVAPEVAPDTVPTVPVPEVEDCTFRMLAPAEIGAGMAFHPDYRVTGTNRQRVAGYGNAVCPPCSEVIVSALVEAITGHDLPR